MDEQPDETKPDNEPQPPVIPDDPAEGIPTDVEHKGDKDRPERETLDDVLRELRTKRGG